jgi:SAM-dependent methyltransferase
MTLTPWIKHLAERALPKFLVDRLDPVRHLIETEIKQVADAIQDTQVVLDAGAGEARHRKYFKRGRYVALDIGYGDSAWDYSRLDVTGDLANIPLQSASVDYVLCMTVLEHTRDPRRVLLEFARVLKPGGVLVMIVPLLWEEHQIPHDYFRFTRYGIRQLLEQSPLRLTLIEPMGGFFWLCAHRSIDLLSFFQRGLRWILFVILAPLFGLLFPLMLYMMDDLDKTKHFSLGFRVRAEKKPTA